MSRSNPTADSPNPTTRWFEWDGAKGVVRYYDKTKKENIECGDKFTFILLDELASVRGWSDEHDCGIFANEVRDTRQETMFVKTYKGARIAEGFYAQIKDRIAAEGGQYVTNLYIAVKAGDGLALASLMLKGAALGTWMEFRKANRAELYDKAVQIKGSTEGKKGKVIFKMPNFGLTALSGPSDEAAKEIDGKVLQPYLTSYFKRTRTEQVAKAHEHEEPAHEEEHEEPPAGRRGKKEPDPDDEASEDDIPF